jgi:beta-lactamase class A
VFVKNKFNKFLVGFLLLCLGFFIGQKQSLLKETTINESRQKGNYKFINPLLECDSLSFSKNATLDILKNQIINKIEELKDTSQISFASVYYRDLNNGPWIGIDEKELFSPASLIKVPLMITYFKQAENNPNYLQQKILVKDNYQNTQNIFPSSTLTIDKEYTYEELIDQMIIYSDNQAYELLKNNIDLNLISDTYTNLGIDVSKSSENPDGDIISVKSYAAFFRVLFNASYLNRDFSEKSLNILSQVKYTEGLVKGINNPNVTVSHKFGERKYLDTGEKQLHDCGIVYVPQKPYLICIMTRGSDFSKLSSSIAKISQIVYQFSEPK